MNTHRINIVRKGGDIITEGSKNILKTSALILFIMVIFLILKYEGWVLVSLLLLLVTVTAVDGAAGKISALTHLPKKLCASGILLLAFLFLSSIGVLTISVFISECRSLLLSLSEGRGSVLILIDSLLCRAEELRSLLSPATDGDLEHLSETVHSLINKGTAYLLSTLGQWATALIGKAPRIIGVSVFLTVSAIWLSVDLDGIGREAHRLIPASAGNKLFPFIGRVRRLCVEYALSHIILFLITFAETYIGLCILRMPFTLALSVLVAVVDILPLLGASAVLLPAAIISAITGEYGISLGISVLLGVLYATRQLTEPYVVGRRIGVHPFLSFLSTFLGLALFGPSGAVIVPLLTALLLGRSKDQNKKRP